MHPAPPVARPAAVGGAGESRLGPKPRAASGLPRALPAIRWRGRPGQPHPRPPVHAVASHQTAQGQRCRSPFSTAAAARPGTSGGFLHGPLPAARHPPVVARRWAGPARPAAAAKCSCRSRCGRQWPRTGRPECAGRYPSELRVDQKSCAGPWRPAGCHAAGVAAVP
ncbi:hypothetical protein D3C79_858040 [compost metagenome]